MATNHNTNDRALQKRKGMAIKGLKAWIKALELNEGVKVSERKYRYEISPAGDTARILLAKDGTTVDGTERPLASWVEIGKPCRLALIGLRYTKDQLERDGERVIYTLNIVSGEAYLTLKGERVNDQPQTIEDWAAIGGPVEKREFESLRVALEYRNDEAADAIKANMVRWGIIRPANAQSE